MKNDKDYKYKNKLIIIILIIIILLLLYFLIHNFGNIYNNGLNIPTGNVDIFDIGCGCCCNECKVFNENDINKNKTGDITVFDNYKIWDNKELRIFSNPAFEYKDIIAPGSYNSYAFVIRNNNDFDIVVDIDFIEENIKNINLQYKLRNKNNYLIGNKDNYVSLNGNKKITEIKIPAKSQISYILDWKWIDSKNDTEIGFDITSHYKLSIIIGVKDNNENN